MSQKSSSTGNPAEDNFAGFEKMDRTQTKNIEYVSERTVEASTTTPLGVVNEQCSPDDVCLGRRSPVMRSPPGSTRKRPSSQQRDAIPTSSKVRVVEKSTKTITISREVFDGRHLSCASNPSLGMTKVSKTRTIVTVKEKILSVRPAKFNVPKPPSNEPAKFVKVDEFAPSTSEVFEPCASKDPPTDINVDVGAPSTLRFIADRKTIYVDVRAPESSAAGPCTSGVQSTNVDVESNPIQPLTSRVSSSNLNADASLTFDAPPPHGTLINKMDARCDALIRSVVHQVQQVINDPNNTSRITFEQKLDYLRNFLKEYREFKKFFGLKECPSAVASLAALMAEVETLLSRLP